MQEQKKLTPKKVKAEFEKGLAICVNTVLSTKRNRMIDLFNRNASTSSNWKFDSNERVRV